MARQELLVQTPLMNRATLSVFSPPRLLLKKTSNDGYRSSVSSNLLSRTTSSAGAVPPLSIYLSDAWSDTIESSSDGIPNVRFLKPRQGSFSSLTTTTSDDDVSIIEEDDTRREFGRIADIAMNLVITTSRSSNEERDDHTNRSRPTNKRRRVCCSSTFKPIV